MDAVLFSTTLRNRFLLDLCQQYIGTSSTGSSVCIAEDCKMRKELNGNPYVACPNLAQWM